jgi:hypothetical protein
MGVLFLVLQVRLQLDASRSLSDWSEQSKLRRQERGIKDSVTFHWFQMSWLTQQQARFLPRPRLK